MLESSESYLKGSTARAARAAAASKAACRLYRVQYCPDHFVRCRHARGVICIDGPNFGGHTFGHEMLVVSYNHPIVLRQKIPGGYILPERSSYLDTDARSGNGSL